MTNKKKCLVTQHLISSINWCMKAPNTLIKPEKGGNGILTWQQKAYDDLSNIVNRVRTPFPEAAERGVKFEKAVYKIANKEEYFGSEKFQQVCKEVKGFKFSQKKGIQKTIGEHNCYLYAKFDAIKDDFIKDIKTTARYSQGKLLEGFQHKLYCYITDIDNFEYVIAEWDEYPKIKNVYIEEYTVEDKESLEKDIFHTVLESFQLLKDLNLWEAYRNKYCLY